MNCGSCTQCCQWGNKADELKPAAELAHYPNGDCIHLDRRSGCKQYEKRPLACVLFDCREFAATVDSKACQAILEKGRNYGMQ